MWTKAIKSEPELKSEKPVNSHLPTPEPTLPLMCPQTMHEDCLKWIKPQGSDVEKVVPGKDSVDYATQVLSVI